MTGKLEAQVKKECRTWLREHGAYVFSPVQHGFGAATVDDLVCFRGHFVAIEYKREYGGRTTSRQLQVLTAVNGAGGFGVIATSLADLVDAFDTFKLFKARPTD